MRLRFERAWQVALKTFRTIPWARVLTDGSLVVGALGTAWAARSASLTYRSSLETNERENERQKKLDLQATRLNERSKEIEKIRFILEFRNAYTKIDVKKLMDFFEDRDALVRACGTENPGLAFVIALKNKANSLHATAVEVNLVRQLFLEVYQQISIVYKKAILDDEDLKVFPHQRKVHMFLFNNQLLDEANYRFVLRGMADWDNNTKPYPYRLMDKLVNDRTIRLGVSTERRSVFQKWHEELEAVRRQCYSSVYRADYRPSAKGGTLLSV